MLLQASVSPLLSVATSLNPTKDRYQASLAKVPFFPSAVIGCRSRERGISPSAELWKAQRWSRTSLGQIDELDKAAVPPPCVAASRVADKWLQCSWGSAVGFGLPSVYCNRCPVK